MNNNGRFECEICDLSFNLKKDYFKHELSDYHLNRAGEEYEEEFNSVAKAESKAKTEAKAKTSWSWLRRWRRYYLFKKK